MTFLDDVPIPTNIVFGEGKLDYLGELATDLQFRRVLVVSDPEIIAAGHTTRGIERLQEQGIEVQLFDAVRENPTTEDVDRGVECAVSYQPDSIIGIGGGSPLDCAKGINFIFTNGGTMKDYHGIGKATKPMLPMVAVPTTAGTGCEAQSFALICDPVTREKMACGDKKAAFRAAILDPRLTLTQPPKVTGLTGIDAISHALETSVTTRKTEFSQTISREAFRLLSANFSRVHSDPQNLEARGGMQLGACFAGMAIEHSMLGAAHALANPLTAAHRIIHGQAVGVMLPHVVRYNADVVGDSYEQLIGIAAESNPELPEADQAAEQLAMLVDQWLMQAGLARKLRDLNIAANELETLAAAASTQWTGSFNPKPVDEKSLLEIYQAAY